MAKRLTDVLTLIDLLQWRAYNQPHQPAYTMLVDGEQEEDSITYIELDQQARAIGTLLQNLGLAGQRVLLLYPPGLNYIRAFFGSLYAGCVAVPVYPPRFNKSLERLESIFSSCQPAAALTTHNLLHDLERHNNLKKLFGNLHWLATDTTASDLAELWHPPVIRTTTLAFLQYTSGSTATPKGVMLSHENLLQNLASMHRSLALSVESRGVIWLPPYHDMGLIGGILQPLFGGFPVTLMTPAAFLQRPVRWLQAISRYHGTISGGPNFAYDLCLKKITPEQRADLDLSSWALAFTGAEPVRYKTIQQFAETFAACGFNQKAFYPCYGLAEATLFVSGGFLAEHSTRMFRKSSLQRNQAVAASPDDADAYPLVSCGRGVPDQVITIVDVNTGIECETHAIGEVWVAGASVAQGYWKQANQTAQTFSAHLPSHKAERSFLRTGDLGFMADDELFITGRLKDLIIIRGRNHYPQDIELTVEQCHPALQKSCCAVFSCEIEGEERLVIAQEVKREWRNPNVEEIAKAIRQAVATEHELQIYAVLLLRPGSIPKTSSGKIQRYRCRIGFIEQSLHMVGLSLIDDERGNTDETMREEQVTREALLIASVPERQGLLERFLQHQLARMVGVQPSQIDMQDSPGAFGLDSLMALELQANIETHLEVVYPLTNFLSQATLAQIANDLLMQITVPLPEQAAQITIQETSDQHHLSYGQKALWFTHHLMPESSVLNIARAVKILGHLDLVALKYALQTLVQRHPALRTIFNSKNDLLSQFILENAVMPLIVEDVADWSEGCLVARLNELAHKHIDLLHDPLLHCYVFTRSEREHILLVVVHHIVVDFWSLALFLDELTQLYTARKSGHVIVLPSLRIQYTDYIQQQNEMLQSPAGEQLWRYWKEQLSGKLPLLKLMGDRQRLADLASEAASQKLRIGIELTMKLKELAHREGVTPYMLLLSALQVLLYRYTGQEDIIVGSPTAGRSTAEAMKLMGYFVNAVAIRADLTGEPGYLQFLAHVRQTVLGAFAHQSYPFALLIERLHPAREIYPSQFFTVIFNWLKTHTATTKNLEALALDEPGVHLPFGNEVLEAVPLKQAPAQFELELTMAEVDDEFRGTLKYDATLFQAAFIARMTEHFKTLLESIVAEPHQKISQLPMLTRSEQQQLLIEWNDSNDYTQERCLHQLFEAQVTIQPDEQALSCPGKNFTYAELNASSNQFAHGLLAMGVTCGQPVAVMMESSAQHIIALFGILKAGGVFVCLDPHYPAVRLRQILEEVGASLLICNSHSLDLHRDLLGSFKALQIILCDIQNGQFAPADGYITMERFATLPITNPAEPIHPTDTAYIAYTSGSTGKPKGIVHTHQNLCQFIEWQSKQFAIIAPQRVAQMASPTFDVSYCEIFGTLCFGATLCLIPATIRHDPQALMMWLRQENISLLQVIASFFAQMLRSIEEKDASRFLPHLKSVIFVGEALPTTMMQRTLAIFPRSLQFYNLYGPTEAVAAICYRIEEVDSEETIPIGRAVHGRQILILDAHQQLCPIGVKGEIYIRSPYLASGYFRQQEATRKAFIQNPFHQDYPDRVYRTGDLGRWRLDGNIEYAGRIDNQIKLRGIRIELEEIEIALSRHQLVRECAVLVHNYSETDQRLLAYAVTSDTLSSQELRRFAQSILPSHMVPSLFLFLDKLPRNPNGKLDRKMLPLPDLQVRDTDEQYHAPQTLLEALVARIWAELLHVDQVGIHDSFFDQGGHSLLAMQLINRVRRLTAIGLPLQTLLEAPTVARLTAEIKQRGGEQLDEKIAFITQKVESLSDDEVRSLLRVKSLQRQ